MGRNKKIKSARRVAKQILQMHVDKSQGKEARKGPAPRAGEKLANVTLSQVRKEFRKLWLEKAEEEKNAKKAQAEALMPVQTVSVPSTTETNATATEKEIDAMQALVEESERLGLYDSELGS